MKATYRGPGDSVELDGLEFKKGETAEMTGEQLARIRATGAVVDAVGDGETAAERDKVIAAQAKTRERQRTEAEKAAKVAEEGKR